MEGFQTCVYNSMNNPMRGDLMNQFFWPLLVISSVAAGSTQPFFDERLVRMNDFTRGLDLTLTPVLSTDGAAWIEAASCDVREHIQSCEFPGFGKMMVRMEGKHLHLSFQANREFELQGLGLKGTLKIPGVRGWLSQGFQSWSQTGVIQARSEPSSAKLQKALQTHGEDEVYRRGQDFSWWMSYIGSDSASFLAGATTAARLKSYVQFFQSGTDSYGVKLISGAGEGMRLGSGTSVGESWFLSLGTDMQAHLDQYAAGLESRRDIIKRPSLVGWNSWYDLWDDVTEADFLANIGPVQNFWQSRRPAGAAPLTMTLDDGWQKQWGDWHPNAKFPGGIDGLARKVKAASMQMGLWIAPLLVHPESDVARQHPDWLVKNAVYRNPKGVNFRVLDVSQPLVAEHLQATFKRLVSWGIDVLKIDFLFAGALEGERSLPWTGMQAYHEALRLIREAVGEEIMIVAVGAPPLATLSYVDAWRVGGDIAFKPALFGLPRPAPSFIANQARSVAGRQAYCQVTLCDADPALLRALSQDEVDAGAWVAAAAGGAMVLSDHMPALDPKRWNWGYNARQVHNGLSAQPARLASYFPAEIPADLNSMKDRLFTAEQKVPELWIMPDGTRVLMNFGNDKKTVEGVLVPKNAARALP
jgi:hypothetical protein